MRNDRLPPPPQHTSPQPKPSSAPDRRGESATTAADAEYVFTAWHDRARNGDVGALLELYLPTATLGSPLVPRVLDDHPTGVLHGHEQLRRFFEQGTRSRPPDIVRWYRTGRYFFDGTTLFWEYPRATPHGDQLDLAEVMDLAGPRISHHRIYWGWAGIPLLARKPEPR